MFVAREKELRVLEDTFKKDGFQMTIIYGRRRIGKSTLITEFIKDKRASYYVARQSSLEDNIRKWSEQYIDDLVPEISGVSFDDPDNFWQFVRNSCKEEKTIVVLDEIPYVAESDSSFLSRFQAAIDTLFADKNIYLILCGSSVSFMENEVLSEKSPIFGRRTNQIFLKPFDYLDSAKFVPNYTNEEKAIVYGVTGGVAKYLTLFDDSLSLDENLIRNFFSPSGYLYEEPMNLLTQEFRTVNTYNTVIELCAAGANKMNEISEKAHISTAALSFIMRSLMTVGIVSKITPITEKENSKKTSYEIADGMYRFWYTFIPSARAMIEVGRGEVFYNSYVKGRLHQFMGRVFEEMCRSYILLGGAEDKLGCLITSVGRWWGADHDRVPTDIDVVGIDKVNNKAVIGECKFQNDPIGRSVYETLLARRGLIDKKYEEVKYLFFSLSGYSKWVLDNCDENSVCLLTLDDLYSVDVC